MAVIKKIVGQITLKVLVDVESITYFYLLMPSIAPAPSKPTTNPPTHYTTEGYDGWSETEPGYTSGDTRSLYVTVRTVYSDGSFEYTTPSLSSSYEAAKEAYNRAQSAMSLAGDTNQYFWDIPSAYSTDVPAGAYVTSIQQSLFKPNPTGGNIIIQGTGLTIRNGTAQLASLTGQALNFYNPQATSGQNSLQLSIGANGALQSGNYSRGSNSKFASAGTKIDLTSGDIITQYFRLSQGLESLNAGAYIHGTIEALDGAIGSDSTNYWDIGNYTDYNLQNSAKIIGHGSSFIQLGDNLTWRLATNRIHTGWYIDTDSYLHFPEFTDGEVTKRWDYGVHVPTSRRDKFLYIRNASSTTSLANLVYDLEDNFTTHYWTYKFYVDGEGNIHAKNFYIGESDTPIGGGTGTIAERIINSDSTYGKGSATQPVYIDSNGRVQTVNWSSETSLTNSNSKIPTSAAVKSFVENKGYTTNTGTVESVRVQASSPLQSSTSTAQSQTLNTTISFQNQNKNVVLAGPATGSAAAPSFRALVASDIPDLSSIYLTSYTETDPTVPSWAKQSSKPTYTANEVGAVATSVVGAANGVAPLNASSKIDSTYLPSYIDDVIEGYYYNNKFWTTSAHTTEIPGEAGKIYVDLATNKTYRYGSSTFTEISQGSLVTVSRSLTSGTKSATITVDGTNYDLYAPTNTNTTYTLSNTLASHKFTSTLTPSSGNASTATQEFVEGGAISLTDDTTNKKITIAHKDTSSQASSSNSGRTYIQSVTLDTYGHVTGLSTATETVTDTHYIANLITGVSAAAKANAAATGGSVYLNLIENDSVRNSHQITGSGTVSVTSDGNGKITITGSAHPTTLPNPKSLKLKVYSGTSTSTDTTYYGGESSNTEVGVAGVTAITGISASAASGGSTTFTLTKANGATSTFDVTVTASVATGATTLTDVDGNAIDEGSATTPVYFSSGVPVSTTYSLNKTVPSNAVFTDTWNAMVGATASANGSVGYVNAVPPKDGYNTKFLRADGTWSTPGGTYSLPLAANGTRGGVQVGFTTNATNRNYAVQLSSEKMYVNVPWENTTYSAGTGLSLSGTTFSNSGVTGVKGNSETNYRTGQVNLTPVNLGAVATTGDETIAGKKSFSDILQIQKTIRDSSGQHYYGGAANRSQWYKITLAHNGVTPPSSAQWYMCSMTIHMAGDYNGCPHGTIELCYYIYWNGSTYAATNVYATGYGPYIYKAKVYYTLADPFVLYVDSSNPYTSMWVDYVSYRDSAQAHNTKETKVETTNAITVADYTVVPTTYIYTADGNYIYTSTHLRPGSNNSSNLGDSSYKWANVYATTFNGNITGNVTGDVTGIATGNVTSIQYDSTNSKFTYTKNGSNSDIVTIANLKTYLGLKALAYKDSLSKSDVGLGNVDNTADANKRVKGANITTTANAIAYYTDTAGTFGSKASANGALYATAANGSLNWGTLPVAQGGTGATTFTSGALLIGNGTSAVSTRAITNNTTDSAITNNNTNIPTMNTIYYGLATINGSSQSRATGIYAPTSAGTSGQVLKSNGSGAPSWVDAVLTDEKVKQTNNTNNVDYRLLFNTAANDTEQTTSVYKNSNLTYNPSIKTLNINDGTIKSKYGKFTFLETEDLTTNTATVMGMLDVKGELHTNKWTSTNIASVGGSFYVSPTYKSPEATLQISGGSANSRTIKITNATFGSTSSSGLAVTSWTSGSVVLITGSVTYNNTTYPLGTCRGTLSATLSQTTATIQGISSEAIEMLYGIFSNTSVSAVNIEISLLTIGGTKPVGILLTSYGTSQATYLDIYGGTNTNTGTPSVPNAEPNLRIGYLNGLPTFTVGGVTTVAPTGWGIYTDNGYFKGTIAADSGVIGGFTISELKLYSGSHDTYNKANTDGIYIGKVSNDYYISGGPGAQWYLKSDGSAKIGAMTLTAAGVLSVPAANISGQLTASQIDVSGITIGQSQVTNLTTDLNNKASNGAEYSVEIEVEDVDYTTNKLKLMAHVYKLGVEQTTTTQLTGITYTWKKIKNGTASALSYNTKEINITSGADLEATYVCIISKS